MSAGVCPSERDLHAFQLGDLDEELLRVVADHLEQCPQCEASVQRFDNAADSILAAIRSPSAATVTMAGTRDDSGDHAEIVEFPFLKPAKQVDEIGRLAGYRILGLAGKGGMAFVFDAEDIALRRRVALKVVRPDVSRDPEGCHRSLREARIMASIKHDHLVTVFQAGEENGVLYLAMELLHGESLGSRIQNQQPPEPEEMLRLARELCSGLAVIHQHGLVHRDIKPNNVWLQAPDNQVKILDFGLARFLDDEVDLTLPGTILGTPSFMSPEQARGETVDQRGDLFSLGSLLYYFCTGVKPFPATQTMAVLTALATVMPPPPRQVNPRVPQPLSDLIMQLLAKKREERPESAVAVLQRLESMGTVPDDAGGIDARTIGPAMKRPRRRRLFIGLALVGALIMGLCIWHFRPLGPANTVYLTSLQPVASQNWPFRPHPLFDKQGPPPGKRPPSPDTPVSIKDKYSPHGIFMHPPPPPLVGEPASITYLLGHEFGRFLAEVSLNDGPPESSAPITFSVHGDGKLLWKSKPVLTQEDTQVVDVSVEGLEMLKIEVVCPGVEGAHAVWVEPRLLKKTKAAK